MINQDGKLWVESSQSQTRSGGQATARHTMGRKGDISFVWMSTDRKLDEASLADLKLTYTR